MFEQTSPDDREPTQMYTGIQRLLMFSKPPTGANGAMDVSSEIIHHWLACSHYTLISYMGMSDEKQHF